MERNDKFKLLVDMECIVTQDKSFPKKNVLGVPPPVEFKDDEENVWEVSDVKVSIRWKSGKLSTLYVTAQELFNAIKEWR